MDGPLADWLPDDKELRREVYRRCDMATTQSPRDTHYVMLDEKILTIGSVQHCARYVAQWQPI